MSRSSTASRLSDPTAFSYDERLFVACSITATRRVKSKQLVFRPLLSSTHHQNFVSVMASHQGV